MNDDPKGSPPEFVLQLDGITKSYNPGAPNAVAVLRGASLQLRAGEIVALVAPSGAGKSTLLHIAGLLDQPDSGRVVLMGQDMAGQTEAPAHARTLRPTGVCLSISPFVARIQRIGKHHVAAMGQRYCTPCGLGAGKGAFGAGGPVCAGVSPPRSDVRGRGATRGAVSGFGQSAGAAPG